MKRRIQRCDSGALARRLVRAGALGVALTGVACGGSETGSALEVSPGDDGVEYRAKWSYESFEVDVELTLATLEGEASCSSRGRLEINDVLSAEKDYRLEPTDCSLLRLTGGGDIVLHGQATGHDWSAEELRVDTERELIQLGPVSLPDAETGEARALRFTLSAPSCPDDDDCECGALRRSGAGEELALDLGRRCD